MIGETAIRRFLVDKPKLYDFARKLSATYRQARRELRTVVLVGPRAVGARLLPHAHLWRKALPVQAPRRVSMNAQGPIDNLAALKSWLGGAAYTEGYDALYLAPESWRATPIAAVAERYPAAVGLKLSRNKGDAGTSYATPVAGRKTQQMLSANHAYQTLIFNFLHAEGIAPRLYDLIEFEDGYGNVWCGYVVEHVDGAAPTVDDFNRVISELRALEQQGIIFLTSPAGWDGVDFKLPDCHGNLLRDKATGRALYVDIHNFSLNRYDRFLDKLANEVASASHFGEQSKIIGTIGGNYLYQEIPGVAAPAKRSPRQRMVAYDKLFADAKLDLKDKLFLDFGCNLGLMGAELQRRGAGWHHGWDFPAVIQATRRTLLAIGCTRFSLASCDMTDAAALRASMPEHLKRFSADETVISYFALRKHIGWTPLLAEIGWRYMIYEGHQTDGELEGYVAELNRMVPVEIVVKTKLRDANSTPRDAAIIRRIG